MKTTDAAISLSEEQKLIDEIEKTLQRVLTLAEREGKRAAFCIGNTTKKINHDYFFTPIRNTFACVAGSIIIDRVAVAEVVVRQIDGRVDYIFVDTEKKISPELYSSHDAGNVERSVRHWVQKSRVYTYKGNDLTVDALDCFLAQAVSFDEKGIGGKKIVIVGAGNIGFKIALKLTERGGNVTLVRRNAEKLDALVKVINYIKPSSTIAHATGTTDIRTAVTGADIVIGLTPGTKDITADMITLLNENAVLIDVGKGSFSPDAITKADERGFSIYRTSIVASFEAQVAMLLKMEDILKNSVGRRDIDGIAIVSGSLLGRKGEIVVDNIFKPSEVYGIADGFGDFNRNPSHDESEKLKRLKTILENEPL